ncbi:ABC transporter ATP-binding protein [Thermococcus litoralis DSM 5473]|uniref:ABC transporter, ATP-binding protein n=4 Tax=Thermococcaceae TaxID=2259 RepID=Q8U4R8_PYRFU|nr:MULTISPECIES: ATP-binding cassette domain-containing protein [Thermococcaceae]AAL80129.1 ABC transporter, ATP-binding protein [Pyrococcus furiosus DSM 3638]AFN04569.1 ABC transporter ATP-binding protein [Pyrococcus furiosus COM1]EHR78286.1 ABC transporter ATP-binding protein [Thermococcus litoralis DSM 5473]QEK79661.1 ABC transporter ATP-binding protein [Pyrococcus furiosus DSM 3638]
MLVVKDLNVEYDNVKVLKGISFALNSGEKAIILGTNGAGKTTLLKSLLGLIPIKSGKIQICGKPYEKVVGEKKVSTNLESVYKLVYSIKVSELIDLYCDLKEIPSQQILNFIKEMKLEHILEKKFYNLSSGEKKCLTNLLAFFTDSKLILLDEPFEGLDPWRTNKTVEILNSLKSSIIMTTHRLDILSKFSTFKVYFLFNGHLYGPIRSASDLVNCYVTFSDIEEGESDIVLRIQGDKKNVILTRRPIGQKISDYASIDEIYRVMLE